MTQKENSERERHFRQSEEVLGKVEGLEELLEDWGKKDAGQAPKEGDEGVSLKAPEGTAAQSSRFYIKQAADFLLGDRDPEANLFKDAENDSSLVNSTMPDNKWINIYQKGDPGLFGVRLGYIVKNTGGDVSVTFEREDAFEFGAREVEIVWFRIIKEADKDIRVVTIYTKKASYDIRDDGIINVSDRS